jgi:hypothetical protein
MIPHHYQLERRVAGLLEAGRDRSTRLPRSQRAVLLSSLLTILGVIGSFGRDGEATLAPAAQQQQDGKIIEALIGQLGSSKFQERAAAQKQLEAIGAPALGLLKKAMQTGDLEMNQRAGELVLGFANSSLYAAKGCPV